MKTKNKIIILFSIPVLFAGLGFRISDKLPEPESMHCGKAILTNMLKSIDSLRGIHYTLKTNERIQNKYLTSESVFKICVLRSRIYLKTNSGAEVLWLKGENNNQALVNPNGFPYLTLKLDPHGSVLRKNKHHTLYETGFRYFGDIVRNMVEIKSRTNDITIQYDGLVEWNGMTCRQVTCSINSYQIRKHKVQKGETLVSIARKNHINEYKILELNGREGDNDYSADEGKEISIPSMYAKKMVIMVDIKTGLPVVQKVYDEKGLFESYEFRNLRVNPTFSENDFSKNNKNYNF